MEPNISESIGELMEGLAMVNLAKPILRQPLILRHQERPDSSQIFEFEDGEEDLDLFDDGEDEYYEDKIHKLVQSYSPTSTVPGPRKNDSETSTNEATFTHNFDLSPNLSACFEEIEPKMMALTDEGTVKKEVIRPGSGVKVPERSRIYYHYMAIVEGHPNLYDLSVSRKYPKYSDFNNTSQLIEGFVIALRSMEMNEVARFVVYPTMAYGERGCPPHIPANAKIIYEVETLHYIDEEKLNTPLYMRLDERSKLPFEAVYEVAHNLCVEGNVWYENLDYQVAIKKWRKGIQILEEYPPVNTNPEERNKTSQLLQFMYSNTGQAYLKLEKPAQACNACELGLQLAEGKDSIKLLYSFSKAKLMLKDCDGALHLVEEGLKLNMKDPDLLQLENKIFLEDAYQRGVIKKICADVSTISISAQHGSSEAVSSSDLEIKGGEEKTSLKGSPARVLKTFFSKKKLEKK